MKVKELIRILKKYPEHEVLLSKDEEGNGYSTLEKEESCFYACTVSAEGRDVKLLVLYPWKEYSDLNELTPEFDESKAR